MNRSLALVVLAACGSKPAPVVTPPPFVKDTPPVIAAGSGSAVVEASKPEPLPPTPKVVFVVASGPTIRFVETGPNGVTVTRTLEAPADVQDIAWVGADPVVRLYADGDQDKAKQKLDGEIGTITATGYVAFPRPPAKTWGIVKTMKDMDHYDRPYWSLVETSEKAIWQGRCEWGYFGDGGECTEWTWARLSPSPLAIEKKTMPKPAPRFPLPAIKPSATTKLVLADYTRPPEDEQKYEPYKILRCTVGTKTVEYPPEDERGDFMGALSIQWLRTEPPMFQLTSQYEGLDVSEHDVIFDGCTPDAKLESASIVPGPSGITAIQAYNDKTEKQDASIRFMGHEIGQLEDVSIVQFAPVAP